MCSLREAQRHWDIACGPLHGRCAQGMVFGVPERSWANLSFGFSLCSHEFSTRTHSSSPQVSGGLESRSFPRCLWPFLLTGGRTLSYFLSTREKTERQKELRLSLLIVCGTIWSIGLWLLAVIGKGFFAPLCFLCWMGILRSPAILPPGKGWGLALTSHLLLRILVP